jgi:hypothetical protein
VLTRFDAYLKRRVSWRGLSAQKKVRGDKGLIVMDHDLEKEKDIAKQFMRIFHLFDRGAAKLHGLRHYTQGGTCACLICKERGHS